MLGRMYEPLYLTLLLSCAAPEQNLPNSYLGRFQLANEALADGRVETAIALYESCFELAPENSTTAYHLACAQARTSVEDALDWLDRAVEWGYADDAVMAWDPDLAALHDHARWSALIDRAASARGAVTERVNIRLRLGLSQPCVSADGERALTIGYGEAVLWDTTSGDPLSILAGGVVTDAQFDVEGKVAHTRQDDGEWIAWDGRTGDRRPEFDGKVPKRVEIREYVLIGKDVPTIPVHSRATTDRSSGVYFRDLSTRVVLGKRLAQHPPHSMHLDSDSSMLVLSFADHVELIDLDRGRIRCTLRQRLPFNGVLGVQPATPHGGPSRGGVLGLVLDDAAVLLVVEDGSLRVVELATGRTLQTIAAAYEGWRAAISWSPRHAATYDYEDVISI